jgi:outer membrane protein OmpA-like peptidoglycan-associated protein
MLKSQSDLTDKTAIDEAEQSHNEEFQRLRSLMLGPDYEKVLTARLENDNVYRVSSVLTEAFKKRNSEDDSLAKEMAPVIESAMDASIKNHPEKITNVIFPIIGPAVRKAVSSALADLMQSLNYLLQNSLSVKSLVWRFKAWRMGVSYGKYVLSQSIQYQVEQVFLIHRESGLLIQSAQAAGVSYQDPDLVSSMLSALSDFAKDSFEQEEGGLETLQMGDLTILTEASPHALLALAVRGVAHNDVKQICAQLVESLHASYAKQLRDFDGDTESLKETQAILEQALIKQDVTKPKSKPWFAIIALSIGLMVIGYFGWKNYQIEQSVEQVISRVNQQKGYRVLSHEFQSNQLIIEVLRSALANSKHQVIESVSTNHFSIVMNDTLASIQDPEIYLPYLASKYNATLNIDHSEPSKLLLSGSITQSNYDALKSDALINSLYQLQLAGDLTVIPELSEMTVARNKFVELINAINSQIYYFESASEILTKDSQASLTKTVMQLKSAMALQQNSASHIVQIGIYGFADSQGAKSTNLELSQKRAELVKSILVSNDIKNDLVISWGGGTVDGKEVPSHIQRRAKIEVLYTLDGVASNDQ